MQAQAIANILDSRQRGTIFTLVVRRPAKTRKDCTLKIEKVSTMQGQITDYANRSPVKQAVADGTRSEPVLPSYIEKSFNVGRTRFWRAFKGTEYLPVCVTGNTPKVQWLLDGKSVQKDAISAYLLSSELSKPNDKAETEDKGQAQFCAITLENIVEIR